MAVSLFDGTSEACHELSAGCLWVCGQAATGSKGMSFMIFPFMLYILGIRNDSDENMNKFVKMQWEFITCQVRCPKALCSTSPRYAREARHL
jgi:hypothetical protein